MIGWCWVSIVWEINGSLLEYLTVVSYPLPSTGHRTLKTYWVSKGSAFSTSISKQEAELSPEMISR